MPSLAQKNILKKIATYLRNSGRDPGFIKQFEIGYCAGISALWAGKAAKNVTGLIVASGFSVKESSFNTPIILNKIWRR